MRKNSICLTITAVLGVPYLALAQARTPANLAEFVALVIGFINILIPFVFTLTLVVLIWGVLKAWVIHVGDAEEVKKGRTIALVGIVALVIMASVWGILALLQSGLFGVASFGTGSSRVAQPVEREEISTFDPASVPLTPELPDGDPMILVPPFPPFPIWDEARRFTPPDNVTVTPLPPDSGPLIGTPAENSRSLSHGETFTVIDDPVLPLFNGREGIAVGIDPNVPERGVILYFDDYRITHWIPCEYLSPRPADCQ